jgi:hypothetical protein
VLDISACSFYARNSERGEEDVTAYWINKGKDGSPPPN